MAYGLTLLNMPPEGDDETLEYVFADVFQRYGVLGSGFPGRCFFLRESLIFAFRQRTGSGNYEILPEIKLFYYIQETLEEKDGYEFSYLHSRKSKVNLYIKDRMAYGLTLLNMPPEGDPSWERYNIENEVNSQWFPAWPAHPVLTIYGKRFISEYQ